jgi:hypothetical protein
MSFRGVAVLAILLPIGNYVLWYVFFLTNWLSFTTPLALINHPVLMGVLFLIMMYGPVALGTLLTLVVLIAPAFGRPPTGRGLATIALFLNALVLYFAWGMGGGQLH